MVVHEFLKQQHLLDDVDYKNGLLACFLHDLGKGFAKHERDGRTFMSGHELISASRGLPWLKEYQELFDLADHDIEVVLLLVLQHTVAHKEEYKNDCTMLLKVVNSADERGRIEKGLWDET